MNVPDLRVAPSWVRVLMVLRFALYVKCRCDRTAGHRGSLAPRSSHFSKLLFRLCAHQRQYWLPSLQIASVGRFLAPNAVPLTKIFASCDHAMRKLSETWAG